MPNHNFDNHRFVTIDLVDACFGNLDKYLSGQYSRTKILPIGRSYCEIAAESSIEQARSSHEDGLVRVDFTITTFDENIRSDGIVVEYSLVP